MLSINELAQYLVKEILIYIKGEKLLLIYMFQSCVAVDGSKAQHFYAIWQWSALLSRKWACKVEHAHFNSPFGNQI